MYPVPAWSVTFEVMLAVPLLSMMVLVPPETEVQLAGLDQSPPPLAVLFQSAPFWAWASEAVATTSTAAAVPQKFCFSSLSYLFLLFFLLRRLFVNRRSSEHRECGRPWRFPSRANAQIGSSC